MTCSTHKKDWNFVLDKITLYDWEILIKIKSILNPFYVTTKYLKGNATKKSHDALWKVVIGLECLIQSIQE